MKSANHLRLLALISLVLSLLAVPTVILAASPGGGPGTEVYLPAVFKPESTSTTGTLENGGTVEGPGGFGIGALTDTLTSTIQVSIAITEAPTATVPSQAQIVGDFYHIGAGESVYTDLESPFILAYPIPAGADTAHLALGMLQSVGEVLDADGGPPAWIFQEGVVDPKRDLFLTTVAALQEDGRTLILVEHPDFESPPNTGQAGGARPAIVQGPEGNLFTVRCVSFLLSDECGDAEETEVAGMLTQIYDHIHQDLGFSSPRLRYKDETLAYDPHSYNILGYSAYIEPSYFGFCSSGNAAGYYTPASGRLVLCMNPTTGIASNTTYILIHEYFHATQYAYQEAFADYADGSEDQWVVEGMAASAMESYFDDQMHRTSYFPDLHAVDVSLRSTYEYDEYSAQDYWVYYGQLGALDLTYLATVLEEGLSSQAVVDALDSNGEILGTYWNWAKNQAMEPVIDFDGALGTPCELELPLVVLPESASVGGYSQTFFDVQVDALGSLVIDLRWDWDEYNIASGWIIPLPGVDQGPLVGNALKYKFYEEGEVECWDVPDGPRTYYDPDPARRYYLLISNTSPDTSYQYRVLWEIGPNPP